jgi:hypothetical protein
MYEQFVSGWATGTLLGWTLVHSVRFIGAESRKISSYFCQAATDVHGREYIVTWRLKAGRTEPEYTFIARQRLGKNVPAQRLLLSSYNDGNLVSVRSDPRLYNEDPRPFELELREPLVTAVEDDWDKMTNSVHCKSGYTKNTSCVI